MRFHSKNEHYRTCLQYDAKPTLDSKEQLPGIETRDSEKRISVYSRIANQLNHNMHQVMRQKSNAVKLISRSGSNHPHRNEPKPPKSQSSDLAPLPP